MQEVTKIKEEQYKEHLSAEDRRSEHQPVTDDNQAVTSDHQQALAGIVSLVQLLAGNHANWTMTGLYLNMTEMLPSHMNGLIYPNPAFASSTHIGLSPLVGVATMCYILSVSADISSSLAISPSSIYNTPNISPGMQPLPGVATGMPSRPGIPSIPGVAPIAALPPTLNALGTAGFVSRICSSIND